VLQFLSVYVKKFHQKSHFRRWSFHRAAKNPRGGKQKMKKFLSNSIAFYLFLCIGVIAFVFSTLTINLEKRKTFDAVDGGGAFSIEADVAPYTDKIFYYTDKKEAIFTARLIDVAASDGATILMVENAEETDNNLAGAKNVRLELSTGQESLFKRIFLNVGRDNG